MHAATRVPASTKSPSTVGSSDESLNSPAWTPKLRSGPYPIPDAFDITAALAQLLAGIGLAPSDSGGDIVFEGADPVVPSPLRLGAAAALALVAKSVAVAALHRTRGGPGQDTAMDLRVAPHRSCPFYDRRWELLNGYPGAAPANPNQAFGLSFYRTRDDRFVMPLNPYPKIKLGAQKLLEVPEDPVAVGAAIARWDGLELEQAGAAAGVVMPLVRTASEFLREPHYFDVLAHSPLVEITKIGESAPEPLSKGAADPLAGIRALGMASE